MRERDWFVTSVRLSYWLHGSTLFGLFLGELFFPEALYFTEWIIHTSSGPLAVLGFDG